MRSIQAPKPLRTFSALPRGERKYKYTVAGDVQTGPGEAPPGFLVATNSVTEWYVYWACFPALQIPMQAEDSGPPFEGVPGFFSYQTPMQGGRSLPGGAVPDFVIERTRTGIPVIVRVVTEYWHLFTSNDKQIRDELQRQRLDDEVDIVDVFDYEFMHDPTGAATVVAVKRAAGLIQSPDPLYSATARRNAR